MSDVNPDNAELHSEPAAQDTHRPTTGFSYLVGRWTPDPAFDEIIASQRKVCWREWKRVFDDNGAL